MGPDGYPRLGYRQTLLGGMNYGVTENRRMNTPSNDERGKKILDGYRTFTTAMLDAAPPEHRQTLAEVIQFRETLSDETDRGAALMAAAFLDDRLRLLIEKRLVPAKNITSEAFEFNGPLGSFSSRINFAFLLGLIPKNARRDLHLVRQIRNKFAHNAGPLDFDNKDVAQLCDALALHAVLPSFSAGSKFRRSVMRLLSIITAATRQAEHLESPPDHDVASNRVPLDVIKTMWAAIDDKPYPFGDQYPDGG